MNNKGRIENSIRNSATGIIAQACNAVLGIVTRTFFIRYLSAEYLGVNGLFSNILTMLSLAEMGIGGAITYSMYKPIAQNDHRKIAQLMNLYRVAIAAVGLCIAPFLEYIIKDQPQIDHLTLIYLLYLCNTVLSYFFAYKRSILSADQMERVIQLFTLVFQVIRYTLQVIVLILFKNFIAFLSIQIVCTFLENFSLSVYADRRYPFLKTYRNEKLNPSERKPIFDNIKALFIYKIGSTALDGTDNIIISAFDGIINVGLLSNYGLITGSLQAFLNKITGALTGSVGNFVAKEDNRRHEDLLDNIAFLHYLLYGLLFVGCMGILQPFISLWAGEQYVLSYRIVFVHCLNIYIFGMMNAVWLFRSTMGLFIYGRWRPLISAIINIVVSILLAKRIGLLGVLLGTTITRVVTNVWFDPYIVYRHGLNKSPLRYYLKWLKYLGVILADAGILYGLDLWLGFQGIWAILMYGIISVLLFAGSTYAIFGKTGPYHYFKNLCGSLMKKAKGKMGRRKTVD